jgi:hypothetical protein
MSIKGISVLCESGVYVDSESKAFFSRITSCSSLFDSLQRLYMGIGVQMKVDHPGKLVAMQIGDFFELAGWDSVLAIEAIGLHGMGLGALLLFTTLCYYLLSGDMRSNYIDCIVDYQGTEYNV